MLQVRNMALILIYVGGISWSAYELQRPSPEALNRTTGLQSSENPRLVSPVAFNARIEQFDDIVKRPLFRPDRRPVSNSSVAPAKSLASATAIAPTNISGLRITAIFKGPDTIAALIELNRNERKLIHKGSLVGTWRVLEISDDKVTLGYRGKQQVFRVQEFGNLAPVIRVPGDKMRPKTGRIGANTKNKPARQDGGSGQ